MGTGRKAALRRHPLGGKTGTTQAYRDAWFVGFTGNYTAAVWFGNDDYTSTNDMTGGSLPAMTWHRLMTYVHQNVELKPIPGLPNSPRRRWRRRRPRSSRRMAKAPSPGPAAAFHPVGRKHQTVAFAVRKPCAARASFSPAGYKPETLSAL